MNSLKNKVQLIGRLGADVEVKSLESGKQLAKISVATNESYKNKEGEWTDNTTWHNVVAWGKTAELAAQLLKKGSEVALEGKLSNRSYEDKDGNKRYVTEVVMSTFLNLSKKPKSAEKAEADLPF
jgi:single-strand DNA-binding protein